MAEIEFTIPTMQYGNAKIRMTPEELYELSEGGISLYDVGMKAQEFLILVTAGFEAGKLIDWPTPKPDVTGQYQESPEPAPEVIAESNEKLNEQAESVIKDQLGATTVEPWTVTPSTTTAKQWEDFDV